MPVWNVLLGHVSLVGPRPDVPGYADRLEGEARRLLDLRLGITGPPTLHWSLWTDIRYILATVVPRRGRPA